MEEIQDIPLEATCTKITLSCKTTDKNRDTAISKEQEYMKKAQDAFRDELLGRMHVTHNVKHL